MSKPRLDYSNGEATQRRTTSGQFTQLSQPQIRELKEAFTLLDKDGDGTVNKKDLEEMLVSLGQDPTDKYLSDMLAKMPSPLTFSSFLTGMSGHLCDVSSRNELQSAFQAFIEDDQLSLEDLQESLLEYGMTQAQVQEATQAFTKHGFKGDQFKHQEFVDIMRPSE